MEQENFVKPMIYDLNNKIKEQKDFIVQLQLLNMDSKRNLIGKLINLAILNSLANYTYTHQLLKCKVERVIYPMINDLLIEQEVLKLQIKEHKDFTLAPLAPLWSKSKMYSCSLAPIWCKSKMQLELVRIGQDSIAAVRIVQLWVQIYWIVLGPFQLVVQLLYSSTVLSTVNLLENFGAQRAIQVQTAAFSSPRNSRAIQKLSCLVLLDSLALSCLALSSWPTRPTRLGTLVAQR